MKKRSIAFLTSLIMLISMLPTAFASSGGGLKPGTGKMKFQLDYMQYTEVAKKAFEDDQAGDAEFSSIDDVGGDKAFYKKGIVEKQDKPKKSAIKVGDEFLVGVKMVDFDNVVESGDGINNMCITLKYDPDYIIAEDTISSLTDDSRNRLGARTGNIFTKHTQSMKYNVSYSFNSNSGDVRADGTINLPLLTSNMDVNSTLTGETDEYIAVLKFKVKAIPTDAKKVIYFPDDTLLANIERFTIALGTRGESATYSADVAEVNIKSIMSLDDSNLDIFPAGAATRTGISVKSGTMASTQFVGDVFKPGVTMQYDLSDAKHEDLDTSDTVTYKYGAASITAADDSGLTAIPATLTTDVNGKHIYAIVGNFICDLGALTVSEIKTTKITVSGAPTTAYDGTAIDFKNLVAKIEKNNGTSVGDIKFTNNYENVSNDLAIYKSNADGDVLAQVTTSDTYTHGPNYFVVAVKSDTTVKSTVFTVTSNYDDITITKDTNAKTSYNKGDKFDPSAIAVKAKKASETGEGTKVSYADFDGNYKVVIATNAEEAKTATAVDANTDITEAMLDGTHKVFVVYTNAGSGVKSVAEVGTLGAKKIKSATISGGKTDYTYGDKLKTDDLKLNVTYDDNSTGKISYADLAAAGITVKIGDTVVKADTVITPDMKDKTVDFIYDSKTLTSSAKITVAAKTVYYTVSDATITKVYDGGLTIPADQTLPTISIKDLATAFVGTDSYTVTGTFAYTDKNVGTDKKIKLTTTLPETNGKYTFAPDTDKINADGTLKTAATITAKALTLNPGVITGLSTKADPNATADVTKDGSLVLTKDNSNLVDGDNVTVPYTYTFGKDDVKTAGNDKPVKIALGDLTGADKDNYTFDKTQVTTAKGNVTQEAFSDIEISGPTKKTYTYPELIPDLSDLVVNAVYGTGTSAIKVPVTNYKLLDKDGNEFDKTAKLPYGDTKITVSYTEGLVTKTKTITLTAKKKPFKLSEITFEASKAYCDDNVNASATLPTDAIIATDADKVKLTFKAEFATPEQVGDAQKVTFSDFKFAKVGEGTEDVSGNYVLVNDEGTEIAADKTVEGTGKITQGTQVAPVAPTVSVNQKTNNIVVAGPLGDNIEYSINGTDWQTGTTFTGLENGKAYTVSARYKATETLAASPASTADATTYKNHLVVYKVNTSTSPLAEIYTNETSATSDNDINTKILTAKPSKFKAYFTDLAGKTAITYPFTLSTETTLYMSQTAGGGGGGGGRSVSIKLDKDTVSGVVGDKIKVTATVTGSTAKPTWTSSNEDVATVDENGNITFVGMGTATVKV